MAKRLRPVSAWQAKGDPIRALAESQERKIGRAFREVLQHLGDIVPVKEIAAKLKSGMGPAAIVASIPFDHWAEVLKTPLAHLGELYLGAADHGGSKISAQLKRGGRRLRYHHPHLRKAAGDGFDFDRFDAGTQSRLRDTLDGLIYDLSDKAKATIHSVVLDGVRAGDTAEDIAKNIRDTISLTPNQAQAVANYRRALEEVSPASLDRALRDTKFDPAIQDAIDSGSFLTDSFVDDAVSAYLDNYLDYRAQTIARTESLRAGNTGLQEGYQQAVDRGVFPQEAVTRKWQIAADENVCPVCLAIYDRNPDGVGLNEPFDGPDGPVENPPEDTHVNCRCTVDYETDLDMVPATEEEEA